MTSMHHFITKSLIQVAATYNTAGKQQALKMQLYLALNSLDRNMHNSITES